MRRLLSRTPLEMFKSFGTEADISSMFRRTVGAALLVSATTMFSLATHSLPASSAARTSAPTFARTYEVRAGDNLTRVSQRFNVSLPELLEANPLIRHRDRVDVGSRLRIPVAQTGLPASIRLNPERLRLRPAIRRWAVRNKIPADLLEATLYLESGWNQARISSTGAVGVGQLMPSTVTYIKHDLIGARVGGLALRASVAEHNIRMSARYLRQLLSATNGDVPGALHRYYQGAGSIAANGLYNDTKSYAASIQALRPRFRTDRMGVDRRSLVSSGPHG